ncbi:MAG: FadR/GntR family transcriptional regulator [Myxococcota bacterium]
MLKPVEKQRVAEEIVEQLRELILTGQYPPGAKLPPERELAKRLGVNRASLREALKKLEHLGLVRIRQGDGTRVQNFMETGGIELVSHLLPLATTSHPEIVRDMLEFRRIFAREVARVAAQRRTTENLERLRELAGRANQELEPVELFDLDFEFYVALTASTQNRVMGLLINTVRDAVRSYTAVLVHLTAPVEDVRKHQSDLIAALESNDSERAAELTDAYLGSGAARVLDMMSRGELPKQSSEDEASDDGSETAAPAAPAAPAADPPAAASAETVSPE